MSPEERTERALEPWGRLGGKGVRAAVAACIRDAENEAFGKCAAYLDAGAAASDPTHANSLQERMFSVALVRILTHGAAKIRSFKHPED